MNRALSVFLAFLVCGPAAVGATTWYVEQDGSGDWVTIQAAVEASADGDTIRIGPGRYSTLHEAPYSLVVAYWDEPKELFFIGAGVDSTVIGPADYVASSTLSYGFNYVGDSPQHLENLLFVNVDIGARMLGVSAWVSNCHTLECPYGVWVENASGGRVSNSRFSMYGPTSPVSGVQLRNTQNVVVEMCLLDNMDVYLHGSVDDTVRNCDFRGEWRGSDGVFYVSSGVFEHNDVRGGSVWAEGEGNILVSGNEFTFNAVGGYNVMVSGSLPELVIYRNVFHGGYGTTIYLFDSASISGSENNILHEPQTYAVKLRSFSGIYPSSVDLCNNYWSTSDPDSIAAWIWDGNDDPTIQQTVQFEPFSTVPLPTEKQSLDSFKSMFR